MERTSQVVKKNYVIVGGEDLDSAIDKHMMHSVPRRKSEGGTGRGNSRPKSADRPGRGRREQIDLTETTSIRHNRGEQVERKDQDEEGSVHRRECCPKMVDENAVSAFVFAKVVK